MASLAAISVVAAQTQAPPTPTPPAANASPFGELDLNPEDLGHELRAAALRLPFAALLGTALALRPRRRGTPVRQPAVVQTQIVLAVVGALIMLVVGASLARAFGIVGAANLIRYRSKIDDPKDAVVMLCTLSVGLASGVGLFGLATFGTLFLVLALWIIEGFEPQTRVFELTVKLGDKTLDAPAADRGGAATFQDRLRTARRRAGSGAVFRDGSEGDPHRPGVGRADEPGARRQAGSHMGREIEVQSEGRLMTRTGY